MASVADLARLGPLVLAAALGACATDVPDPSASASHRSSEGATPGLESPRATPGTSSTPSVAATPSPAIALPELASPFDGATILDAMRSSRRPGGVPDVIETPAVAASIAESIKTHAGAPWTTLTVGGSCGPQACTVEVAGAPPNSAGEDLYVFSVDPGSGAVRLVDATLAGLSPDLVAQLDALARRAIPSRLETFILATARRDADASDAFVLSYRSGGEEGSPSIDLVVDATTGDVRPAGR